MFDAASRYLLFPLKRVVADALLPHLEMVSPAELCHWLVLSDMYVPSAFFSHIPSLNTYYALKIFTFLCKIVPMLP